MKRLLRIVVVAFVFVSIYLAMHFYVLSELFHFIGIPRGYGFYILMIVLSLSFIGTMVLERTMPNVFTRVLYTLSSVWLGVLFISLWILLINSVLTLFIEIPLLVQGTYTLSLIALISLYSLHNATRTNITWMTIPLKNLKKPLKIVQLTDIHIGTIRSSKFLKKIVETVNSINPNFVVITGDLFDGSAPLTKEIVSPLNDLKAPAYFVIGNHEIYDGIAGVSEILKSTKLKVLRNEKSSFKEIQIIGVDFSDDKKYLEEILPRISINKKKPAILLYHPPASLEPVEKAGIGLQLSGHTHKGQIFPFNLFVRLAYPYVTGLHTTEKTSLYISPGTGTWGPPMRLGSRNEITVIDLVKEMKNKK
ncbi:metallophosphoesterase [Candidatus Pacearchaeota archaeon]|nr:metallophosphoesterase [Candidatus Pacearchaeota archaeon]